MIAAWRRLLRGGPRPLGFALLCTAGSILADGLPAGRAAAADAGFTLFAEHRDDGWDDDDWEDGWDDYNRTLLQLQREMISSQEEAAREAGRTLRRDELEKDREKDSAEREAYFDAVISSSQAALRAPRGAYYRKPGYSSPDPPGAGAQTVEVGGIPFEYDQGIFWIRQGTDYLVVTAPFGAVVRTLPRGAVRVPAGDRVFWYFFGTFFAESGDAYSVVKPPPGLTVYYLPDGYTREKSGGADVYRFGETLFKPIFVQGVLAYQVVADR